MDGQPPAVEIVGLVTEQIKKLAVHQSGYEIKGAVRIRKDHKQCRFFVAQGVQLQFVRFHKVPEFFYVKGSQARAAAH